MEDKKEFREDHLQLLGPEIHTLEPQDFYDRIVGLYQPRVTGGKAKEVEIKGKKIKAPTKKAHGTYEMRNQTALGEKVVHFTFTKEMNFREDFVKKASEILLCAEQKLTAFLEKKKFIICSCAENDLALQQLSLAQSEEKETNNENSS